MKEVFRSESTVPAHTARMKVSNARIHVALRRTKLAVQFEEETALNLKE